MLAACLESICEIGYYRSSSNEIARRAGVSWGVIQHHFGSRQQLLFAVFEQAIIDTLALFADLPSSGESDRERLAALADLVVDFHARKEYAAILQIMWNLYSDPETEASTVNALDDYARQFEVAWNKLCERAFRSDIPPETTAMLFTLLWGTGVYEANWQLVVRDRPGYPSRPTPAERKGLLVEVIEMLIARHQ